MATERDMPRVKTWGKRHVYEWFKRQNKTPSSPSNYKDIKLYFNDFSIAKNFDGTTKMSDKAAEYFLNPNDIDLSFNTCNTIHYGLSNVQLPGFIGYYGIRIQKSSNNDILMFMKSSSNDSGQEQFMIQAFESKEKGDILGDIWFSFPTPVFRRERYSVNNEFTLLCYYLKASLIENISVGSYFTFELIDSERILINGELIYDEA